MSTTGEWINKTRCTHTMECYSTLKIKGFLIYATTWMNHENIILSEKTNHRKANTKLFHLYKVLRIVKTIETESRMVFVRDYDKEMRCNNSGGPPLCLHLCDEKQK